jgi:trk system potassium uptake protein TrkA
MEKLSCPECLRTVEPSVIEREESLPVRGEEVIIAHHDTLIESGDHVILFVVNKRMIPKVERLFQVGVGFL